jgi:hypothetical protein
LARGSWHSLLAEDSPEQIDRLLLKGYEVSQLLVDVNHGLRHQPAQFKLALLALALVIGCARIHRLRCHLLRVSLADGARAVATFLLAILQTQDALDIG